MNVFVAELTCLAERVGSILFQSSSTEFRCSDRGKTPNLLVDTVSFALEIRTWQLLTELRNATLRRTASWEICSINQRPTAIARQLLMALVITMAALVRVRVHTTSNTDGYCLRIFLYRNADNDFEEEQADVAQAVSSHCNLTSNNLRCHFISPTAYDFKYRIPKRHKKLVNKKQTRCRY